MMALLGCLLLIWWCNQMPPVGDKLKTACYGVLRFVMESGAKGCEVIVSGKLRAQRAKSMKFKDGYMISSGPVAEPGSRYGWGTIEENFSYMLCGNKYEEKN